MKKLRSIQFQITISILIPIILIIIITNLFTITYTGKVSKKLSYRILEETAKKEANNIKDTIYEQLSYASELKIDIENLYKNGEKNRDLYINLFSEYFDSLSGSINGLYIAFEPNILGNDSDYINSEDYAEINGRFNYYITRKEKKILPMNTFNEEYYTEPKRTGENYITGIYKSMANPNTMLFTLCVPIKYNNTFIGVVGLDIFTDSITSLLKDVAPFENTTTALYDQKGFVIYDSFDMNLVSKNIYEAYPHYKKYNVYENFQSGKLSIFDAYGEKSKKYMTYSFCPIEIYKNLYWGLEFSTPQNIILKDSNIMRNILSIILIIVIIIISIVVPTVLKLKVTNIIGYLNRDISKLADSDISWETPEGFSLLENEWGGIARGIDKTLLNLNTIVKSVKSSAKEVSAAANEVLSGNNDLSFRTESQAASLEETAASMNEMASAIKESTDNVSQTTEMVLDAKVYLDKAENIVEDSVKKMDDVYEASTKIMDITKLIENIAFQTNILALNASVEAARAGEQGRGFAVVASEVRNLAQNSQESVKSITSLILDSNEKIRLAAESVKETKDIFNEILSKMDTASILMDKVNTATSEQEKGIYQVNDAISAMDSSVQQNASLVQKAASASESLLNEANKLVKVIEGFKIRE